MNISIKKLFSSSAPAFKSINSSEAAAIMASGRDHIVVDVRRPSEFASGHIPGAVNIPNESIGSSAPASLPEKDRLILVHCLSGARSRAAASKLAAMGYSNVLDFGGISSWQGALIRD